MTEFERRDVFLDVLFDKDRLRRLGEGGAVGALEVGVLHDAHGRGWVADEPARHLLDARSA